MRQWQKLLLALAVLPVALVAFATFYLVRYSMDRAEPFVTNNPNEDEHVLIATQGSAFKDAVVRDVAARLAKRPAYVKVIDVSSLSEVREPEWNAIVVLHTWEMSKAPEPVKTFVDRVQDRDKLVVLATSGDGDQHIAGVDTITSASDVAKAGERADAIVVRVEKVLASRSPRSQHFFHHAP